MPVLSKQPSAHLLSKPLQNIPFLAQADAILVQPISRPPQKNDPRHKLDQAPGAPRRWEFGGLRALANPTRCNLHCPPPKTPVALLRCSRLAAHAAVGEGFAGCPMHGRSFFFCLLRPGHVLLGERQHEAMSETSRVFVRVRYARAWPVLSGIIIILEPTAKHQLCTSSIYIRPPHSSRLDSISASSLSHCSFVSIFASVCASSWLVIWRPDSSPSRVTTSLSQQPPFHSYV